MNDILISSSVLILLLIALRAVFRKTVSARVQYALWGIVLLRLLVPVSLPAADFSVLTVTEPVRQTVSANLEAPQVYVPVAREPLTQHPTAPDMDPEYAITPGSPSVWVIETDETAVQYRQLSSADILRGVWLSGTVLMSCWLVVSNLRFARRLRKARAPYTVEDYKYQVYIVETGLPSPCLFGLFRPAIYLTPAALEEGKLRHVLAHEETHARHLDPLWSALRCLCLVVYWFDPLVWMAARLSKTDCELACDEGTLVRLGEAERIPYGRTLLSLVPVRRSGDPLLSATTMTAGKRQLKDRITRIAQNQRTVAAALFILLSAVALVCIVTFSGGKERHFVNEEGAASVAVVPLSGEELTYFNEEFFNNAFHTIRNQLLSSTYEKPEDIDLFELFYCGAGLPAAIIDEELAIVGSFDESGALICETTKITAEAMDEVLLTYTGLTLTETNQVNLDQFTWLPEYDAYYHSHGDTNYRGWVTFSAGEREGDVIRLYYEDNFLGGGWKCVTLKETTSGYWFISNLPAQMPAVPTVYPEGEPWLTIPLTELAPYEAEAVKVEHHSNDCAERDGGGFGIDDVHVVSYLSTDGNRYVAVKRNGRAVQGEMVDWEADCFLTLPDSAYNGPELNSFSNLFGQRGIIVSYVGPIDDSLYNTINNFYTFDEAGTPSLLARAYGEVTVADLDGDGNNELAASAGDTAQLFFQRDGVIYEADLDTLLAEHWPEVSYPSYSSWSISGRNCILYASTPFPGTEDDPMVNQATAKRTVYFDGENLLLYKTSGEADLTNIPADVAEAARQRMEAAYTASLNGEDGALSNQSWDGCRLSRVTQAAVYNDLAGKTVAVYEFYYEFHSAAPEKVMAAGGSSVDEDGWYSGFWREDGPYLIRIIENDGSAHILKDAVIPGDTGPESVMFRANLIRSLIRNGVLSYAQAADEDLMNMFYENPWGTLDHLGQQNEQVRQDTLVRLADYAQSSPETTEDFQHAMDRLFFNPRDLTNDGGAAYRILVDTTNRWSVPSRVHTTISSVANQLYEADRLSPEYFGAGVQLTNYRIKNVQRVAQYEGLAELPDQRIIVYRMAYEYAAADPAAVATAGGQSVDQNGWFNPASPWTYVFFRLNDDHSQTYLYYESMDDCAPGDEAFTRRMLDRLGVSENKPEPEAQVYTLPLSKEPEVLFTQYASRQEAYDSIDWDSGSFFLDQELTVGDYTIVSWGYGGTPHGTAALLDLIYPDGTRARLPLPPRNGWGVADSPQNLTLDADAGKLTYTAHFDEDLPNSDVTALIHQAGTYHYTYDIASRTIALTVIPD